MTIDVRDLMARGGRGQADLLEFCVLSVNTDVLFLFLVDQYRLRPQAGSAAALFDLFCASGAPARLSTEALLPPRDQRLAQAVARFRVPSTVNAAPEAAGDPAERPAPPPAFPPKYLFDPITQTLATGEAAALSRLQVSYDPEKTPHENLPGGTLTAGQRMFVDHVWTPVIRPRLVSAGFWRVAAVA